MKNKQMKENPFFIIGTMGMLIIALLHMIFTLIFSIKDINVMFFGVYPTFLTFLLLGVKSIKKSDS